MSNLEELKALLERLLAPYTVSFSSSFAELTVLVDSSDYHAVCAQLRDCSECPFEMMIDLCGVDYLDFSPAAGRFAVVVHLLSLSKNRRLRVRCFCSDQDRPSLPSIVDLWPCANWFEREAFDLFGIIFQNHPDLRRILTDYGFKGHPFRKDFPISGYVEVAYDKEQKRVAYQPVTIEPRMNVPRLVREDNYGDSER